MNGLVSENKSQLIARLFDLESLLESQCAAVKCRFRRSPLSIQNRFQLMAEEELSALVTNLANYTHCLKVAMEEGVNPWDDTEFLVLTMRELGLTFPKEFIDHLGTASVVEAYDMNRRQTFRNLRFMEISNYSLLEVLSYDWPMLFHRDTDVTNQIIKQGEQDLWTDNQVIKAHVPKHFIRELLSEEPQICEVQQHYFAPLYSGPNRPGGGLVVSDARPVGRDASVDRENLAFI